MSDAFKAICFAVAVFTLIGGFIGGRMLQIQWQADIYQKNLYQQKYEKAQSVAKKQIAELKSVIAERDRKRDNFLKEYKRAGKYFE